jgi:hypothetical protein
MNKLQKILLAVLAAQILLIAFVFWPKPKTVVNRELVMGERTADEVSAVSVADSTGNIVNLTKVDDNWVLADLEQYPADATKVDTMLEDIFAVRYGRLVTETSASHDRLEVGTEKFNRKITLTFASGDTQAIYVGSTPATAATNFRMDGEEQVYLSDQLSTYSYGTTPANWINTSLTSITADTVQSMILQNANGEIVFNLKEDGSWSFDGLPAGETVNSEAISNLVSQITGLRITEPLGKTAQATYGLKSPSAKLVLSMKDEQGETTNLTFTFGTVDEEAGSVVVQSSASEYYAKVSSTSLEQILTGSAADFITQSETGEATPQS